MTEDDLALCLMLNACLKNEKKVGVVQLGHHRWFGLISSMNEGITDCLVLHVLSPKLPPYDLMAWTESTPPALISTLAPPYSPLSTAFPIKKAKRLRDREGRLLDPVHLARRPAGNWLRNGWLAQAGEEENKPPPSVRMEQPQQHLLPTHTQPQSLPPGLNVTGPPYFGTFNRPARQQADEVEKWDTDATDYNIWYNKKCGDYRSKRIDGRESAAHRCQILKDAGITRSDENSYICVYFARGKCVRGADCTFHHRIPDERDEARLDITYDVFGRERHRTDRDDMGGVGTFSRDNRTLYIGGVRRVKGVDLQELVVRNFIEFGELESVRVIWDKSIAFVRYKLRAASEFAKEAMADQSLGYKEVLNVRWANDDPNPRSQREKAFAVANQAYNAVMAHGGSAPYPDMSTLGTGDAYPTTDGQYGEAVVPAEYQQALQYASTYYPGTTHQPPYDPAAAGGVPQEESALSLLSAYDVDSYADRYGSSTDDQQQPAGEAADEQQARGAVLATTAQDQQQAQADYTSDQWRQWYMYYYGYVPAELPSAGGSEAAASMPTSGGTPAPTTPAIGPALRPHPAGVSAGGTPQEQDAPAKKLRTK